jgi:argininosuccinate lyase
MPETSKLWGGRFTAEPDTTFAEFNRSFDFDIRLFEADLRASLAWANAVATAGVLTNGELRKITRALREIGKRAAADHRFFDSDAEDVHSFIEGRLVELVGDAGKKLHTGRSRNDQVATAFRLWLRGRIDSIDEALLALQRAMVAAAERHNSAVLPGYTHLQRAQPVLWAHWCLAYFEMMRRDRERLAETRRRVNVSPLGSAALAGTGIDVDRTAIARELGFDDVTRNSLDGVSDRDFAVEFTSCGAVVMMHLSRLAEDLILYCSAEFGFVELSDSVSSGSSLMPQKKNPDALELLRGRSGRVFGHLTALLSMMKGLPLAYNKDMQEDKEAVFDTADTVETSLRTAAVVIENINVNEATARDAATLGYLNATELADYLVKRGVPFRAAHEAVGQAVLYAIGQGKELNELTLDELSLYSKKIGDDVFQSLSLKSTLASKNVIGGTSPKRVKEALREAKRYLKRK